jgi:hypothetical protein
MKTPILFLIFNRPKVTQEVFNAIKLYQPSRIYVAADGPRKDRKGENILCETTRSVVSQIDWKCEVFTLFRDTNLGCKDAVSSAITWFFEQEEMGIILEDDCLPDVSFFSFCTELLERYKFNDEIMAVSGQNFLTVSERPEESYFFSEYPLIWGWATWRRAWVRYDKEMVELDSFLKNDLNSKFEKSGQRHHLKKNLIATKKGRINTWDYQWFYSVLKTNGRVAISTKNLVVNIGFRNQSTHEFLYDSFRENDKLESKNSKIIHPMNLKVNKMFDYLMYKNVFAVNPSRIFRLIRENGVLKIFSHVLKAFKK